ncbi:MAG: SusD/RagB family nutrient-binding outer membrane lipoprotein [Dysgonamonadaceae bacterium]|jgi:hypothetical protein|nr:SusD/RagB family nutrient-binding outer membrane lipoprotein [Dysgonamonadaceae bacterium]
MKHLSLTNAQEHENEYSFTRLLVNSLTHFRMKIYKFLILPVALACSFFACTDGFEEMNKNPNKTPVVEPEYIFGLSPVYTMRVLGRNSNWFFFGNYTNQMSVVGGGGPHFGKDGRSDGLWNDFYVNALNPLIRIEKDFGDNPAYTNRVAIAKIWKSYIFSQMVAMWGPLPYTEACNEGPYMKFDDEATIYRGILKDLKDAYTALDPTAVNDKYPPESEPFLQSDITRWSQFAHCIRLRVAFRLTEVEEKDVPGLAAEAQAIVREELDNAENGLLISNNSGNFFMKWGEEVENQNPFYKEITSNPRRDLDDPGDFPVIHEDFILWVGPDSYDDPCLTAIIKKGSGGSRTNPLPVYFGRSYVPGVQPPGYEWPTGKSNPYSGQLYPDYAQVGNVFAAMTAEFPFFTYPEIACYRAEASYKGWWGLKSAEEYYYEAIDARCARFGAKANDIARYKEFPGIKWSTPSDTVPSKTVKREGFLDHLGLIDSYLGGEEDNYKRIIVQEWINFFYQGVDSWTLLRRTQVLDFLPHFNASTESAYVDATWAYIPHRLAYPGPEVSMNTAAWRNAVDNLLLDNTLKNKEDQITFRLIFGKYYDGVFNLTGWRGDQTFTYPNMARNRAR